MARVRDIGDKLLGGRLEANLRDWRGEGKSYDEIARLLAGMGIDVTSESVRRWCREYGIEETATSPGASTDA